MQGDKRIDKLMLPVLNAINRHVKDIDAKTDIYNRAYEAVMISMVVKTSTTGVKTPESIENPWIPISSGRLPNKFQECIVLDSSGHVHNWIHDDVLLPLFAQYTHWMPLPESPNDTQTDTVVYGKERER